MASQFGTAERLALGTRRLAPIAFLLLLLATPLAGCQSEDKEGPLNFAGDARRGAALIEKYGCGSCHDIPSVARAEGNVGPPLSRIASRTYIAGFIHNSPENMVIWIEDPQKVLPGNAMPSVGVSSKDARDITAFLYTLK